MMVGMSNNEVRALERQIFEVMNEGKAATVAEMDKVCSADILAHTATGNDLRGVAAFKQYMIGFYDAFPDLHITIEDILVDGDKAATRYTYAGTNRGAFMGVPPTNRKITGWAIEIDRFSDGRLVELWGRLDTLGLMQQLGLIPAPKR